MKIIMIAVIIILSLSAAAFAQQSCDYRAEILLDPIEFTQENFTFRIRALNIQGPGANTTSTAAILTADGTLIKKYRPWTGSPISKQKTSGKYSPNLAEGIYDITVNMSVTCDDFNTENNADRRRIIIRASSDSGNIECTISNAAVSSPGQNGMSCPNQTQEVERIIVKECPEEEKTIDLKPETNSGCGTAYESGSEKSSKLIVYSLLAVSIILNIALVWRKKSGIL